VSGEDLDGGGGGRREGVGTRCGPGSGRGSSRRGTDVNPTTIGEAVGTTSRRMRRRSGHMSGPNGSHRGDRRGTDGAGAEVIDERAHGWRRNHSSQG
jgi:hypothetical protein